MPTCTKRIGLFITCVQGSALTIAVFLIEIKIKTTDKSFTKAGSQGPINAKRPGAGTTDGKPTDQGATHKFPLCPQYQ